jgi:hypothetical protein
MSNIQDILKDIVTHTHSLGFLPIVKVSSQEDTMIESMAEDKSVILNAKTHDTVPEFTGIFGMPNLEKLALHLKNPEYKENAKIKVVKLEKNGVEYPANLYFENATGDFRNEYRFMNTDIINEKLKTVKFRGAKWDVEFQPSLSAIQRLKLQAQAHHEEDTFQVNTNNGDLVVLFGNSSTHAGSFVFEPNVNGALKRTLSWPVTQVMCILNLNGDKTVRISDAGAMQIKVDSGLALYEYILPALSK